MTAVERIEIHIESGSRIEANGTINNPIVFQSVLENPTNDDWNGFIFSDSSVGVFSFAVIKNTADAISANFTGGRLEISSSQFQSTEIHIENADSTTFLNDSQFLAQSFIRCWNSSIMISGNNFIDKSYIELYADSSTLKNNVMVSENGSNFGVWLRIYNSVPSTTQIINNNISFYSTGIQFSGSGHNPTIKNNILYQNSFSGSLQGTIQYNNFWNNDSASYIPPGTTNIEKDPKFVDAVNGDFHLRGNSPCIDRGDPADDYSLEPQPNGGRINMGAYGNTPEATLSFDVIAGSDLTTDTTWSGHVIVLKDIATAGHTLTVQPGTKVLFENGASLTVEGPFISNGYPNPPDGPDPIEYRGYREGDKMGGVILTDESETNVIRYCNFKKGENGLLIKGVNFADVLSNLTFEDNDVGLYLASSKAVVENSTFRNNESGMIADYSNLTLSGSDFNNNNNQGLYLSNSQFNVFSNTFQNNGLRGVYFQYSSDGTFNNNSVTSNGISPVSSNIKGGLVFYQSSPQVMYNSVSGNAAPGVLSLSSSYPLFVEEGLNLISENGSPPADFSEILVKDISFPVMDWGHNDVMDSTGGYLIYGDEDPRDILIYIRYNYWGTVDEGEIESRIFRPGGFVFTPFDEAPNTQQPASGGGGEGLLKNALAAEQDSNYTYAITLYDSLVQFYPATLGAKVALERLFFLKIKTGESINGVKSYYDGLSNHPNEALATVAKRLAYRSLTYDGQYQSAIDNHTQWSQTTPYFSDSLYSQVDILSNQLQQSGTQLRKSGSKTAVRVINEIRFSGSTSRSPRCC